jgi:hypothetical protein
VKAIALDSQLLVLLIVGDEEPEFIQSHKRLGGYSADDFELLKSRLEMADVLVLTPHVIAEASNLLRHCHDPMRSRLTRRLGEVAEEIKERHRKTSSFSGYPEFQQLGVADCMLLTDKKAELLTADVELWRAAIVRGRSAYNFTHLREQAGLL